MKARDLFESDRYKAKLIAKRFVRQIAKIPPDVLPFLRKHVKKEETDYTKYIYINQYDDDWYRFTFDDPDVIDFKSFFKKYISEYFAIINTDGL